MNLQEKILKLKTDKIYHFHLKYLSPITMEDAQEKAKLEIKKLQKMLGSDLYQVIRMTNGYEEHTTDLTFDEAVNQLENLHECFPNEQYEIHPQAEPTKEKEYRFVSRRQADGWEDLHN